MKFAHLSDIHLGLQTYEELQKIEQEIFERALDVCISHKVDFILMPGDIFHTNIPPMRVQKYAFAKFRQVHDANIPIYVVYGSHDFSPVSNSVIDLLAETGYITKVTMATSDDDGAISLEFVTDKKTGVKIAGLSGLKVDRDRDWYENLVREPLEAEPGFKIFLFHGWISDMTPAGMYTRGDPMPLSLLPKGFAYYAGGHLHRWNHKSFPDYPHVVYPGTPFAGQSADLEENAKGQERGFVMVEFGNDAIGSVEFIHLENTKYEIIEVDANDKKGDDVNRELQERTGSIDPKDKVVIVKVTGEMSSGKTSDIDISAVRDTLNEGDSLVVNISKSSLTSKEYSITSAKGSNREEIEANVISENIGQLHFKQDRLMGTPGIDLTNKLLHELSHAQLDNETRNNYESRIRDNALAILEINDNNDP